MILTKVTKLKSSPIEKNELKKDKKKYRVVLHMCHLKHYD